MTAKLKVDLEGVSRFRFLLFTRLCGDGEVALMAERGDTENSNPINAQLVIGIGDRLPPPGGEDLTSHLGKMQLNTEPAAGGANETLMKSIGTNLKGITANI